MRHWYLEPSEVWPDDEVADANGFFTQFVRFVVLLNALIPISLYVTLELVKVIQCFLIARDRELYDAENDRRCGVRTTTLNEELGAVSCVLSDKTGTLTRNVMAFVKCSVAGVVYGAKTRKTPRRTANSANSATTTTPSRARFRKTNAKQRRRGRQGRGEQRYERVHDFDALDVDGASRSRLSRHVSVPRLGREVRRDRYARRRARARARAAIAARHPPVAAFLEHLATCRTVVPEPGRLTLPTLPTRFPTRRKAGRVRAVAAALGGSSTSVVPGRGGARDRRGDSRRSGRRERQRDGRDTRRPDV